MTINQKFEKVQSIANICWSMFDEEALVKLEALLLERKKASDALFFAQKNAHTGASAKAAACRLDANTSAITDFLDL